MVVAECHQNIEKISTCGRLGREGRTINSLLPKGDLPLEHNFISVAYIWSVFTKPLMPKIYS